MRLSECIFYSGESGMFSDPATARDALDELFTHSDHIPELFLRELTDLGIRLPNPPIRVISVSPGPGEGNFTMEHARWFAQEVQSAFSSEFPGSGIFYYTGSQIQGVFHCAGKYAVQKVYDYLCAFTGRYQDMARPHVALSGEYDDLTKISLACDENREAHLFERFLSDPIDVVIQPNDFFLYGSLPPNGDDAAFFSTMAQRIANATVSQDRNRTHEIIDEALGFVVTKRPRVSAVHIRALHFCQSLELYLVSANLIDRTYVQRMDLVNNILQAENEEKLRFVFHDQMNMIYDYAQERRSARQAATIQQIADYIDQNLSDCLLSIPSIAAEFHISNNRLSAEFRSYFGVSIPDYIHTRRIDRIKTALRDTDKSIRDIGMDAGYVSVATMNRAFLRQEGITPGQYRKTART